MEQQRALTVAQRMEKKKVIILQQHFSLLCTALPPGIKPQCPSPQWMDPHPAIRKALGCKTIFPDCWKAGET